MNILKRIFASSESANSIIDGAKKGIDALVFTDEEKEAMSQDAFKLWIEFQKATSGQNLARRYLALIVFALWAGLTILLILMAILGSVFAWESVPHMALMEIMGEMRVTELTLLVALFYFGKHTITSALDARK